MTNKEVSIGQNKSKYNCLTNNKEHTGKLKPWYLEKLNTHGKYLWQKQGWSMQKPITNTCIQTPYAGETMCQKEETQQHLRMHKSTQRW